MFSSMLLTKIWLKKFKKKKKNIGELQKNKFRCDEYEENFHYKIWTHILSFNGKLTFNSLS